MRTSLLVCSWLIGCVGPTAEDSADCSAQSAQIWYTDADDDGLGDPATAQAACAQPDGTVADGSDCDDSDAILGGPEICDGLDNDCDAKLDSEDDSLTDGTIYYEDGDDDGFGSPSVTVSACEAPLGYAATNDDCDDTSPRVSPAGVEVCNGMDDDCDALSDDEDDSLEADAWYFDADGDGFGDPELIQTACDQPTGFVANREDCDDTDVMAGGGAEVCDDRDNDCDGLIDGQDDSLRDAPTWYQDQDMDTLGDAEAPLVACAQPRGYVANALDCDDTSAEVRTCGTGDDGSVCATEVGADTALVPTFTGACEGDFVPYNGHCYYAVASDVVWRDARASCMAAGGYLATVADVAENEWVVSLTPRPYIGACDGDVEGTFVWVNGDAVSYTKWHTGEPNDADGQDCVEIASAAGTWNDTWCDNNPDTDGFVCEFE